MTFEELKKILQEKKAEEEAKQEKVWYVRGMDSDRASDTDARSGI